jgi:hypothetical protein
MSEPKGPYTVWIDYGYEGWRFKDFGTIEEALSFDESYGMTKHISKPVKYRVEELEDVSEV